MGVNALLHCCMAGACMWQLWLHYNACMKYQYKPCMWTESMLNLSTQQEISERVEREIAYKMKEVNASLDEKEKQLTLLQEKQLQKSKENGDLLNEKTLLEEQHVKQMQAMAEYSDSINEKQQKIDAMQQEIWDLKKVDFKVRRLRYNYLCKVDMYMFWVRTLTSFRLQQ